MSDDDTSLSSLEMPQLRPRRQRRFRRISRIRRDFFTDYSEEEFKSRFRFSKASVTFILNKIKPKLVRNIQRRDCISPMLQLLIALRFYATGSFQAVVGDTVNVSKATVCRVVDKVTCEIALLRSKYVRMPTAQERPSVAAQFFEIAGFPRIIGAVDCTHIKIVSPGGNRAELYRNRKGYFSVNVQAICDANLKIQSIIARWPGSVHDTTIWNDSPLAAQFETGRFGSFLILGDSGYPCLRYLMTPILNPTTPPQEAYNRAHITTRNTIERCFGVLKRRFPCLQSGMQLKLPKVLKVIVACVVLHNMTLHLEDYIVQDELAQEDHYDETVPQAHTQHFAARTAIVENYFST